MLSQIYLLHISIIMGLPVDFISSELYHFFMYIALQRFQLLFFTYIKAELFI